MRDMTLRSLALPPLPLPLQTGAGIADPSHPLPAAAAVRLSKKEKRRGRDKAGRPHTSLVDAATLSGADWERMHDPTTDHRDRDAAPQADYAEALLSDIESAEETSAAERAERRRGVPVANFRFAHAETVMPLTSLLGIFDTEQTLEQLYLSQCVGCACHSASRAQARPPPPPSSVGLPPVRAHSLTRCAAPSLSL